MPEENRYAAPGAESVPKAVLPAELVAIRRAHQTAELAIRLFGVLNILAGLPLALLTLYLGLVMLDRDQRTPWAVWVSAFVACGVATVLVFAAGVQLLQLKPLGRRLQLILLSLAVIPALLSFKLDAFPIVSFACGLHALLWLGKARSIFGQHYQQVVLPETRSLQYQPGAIAKAVGAAVAVLFIGILLQPCR